MIRTEVQDLLELGSPQDEDYYTENDDAVGELEEFQRRFERISGPVTSEEARALLAALPPDDCFGYGWSLIHLIETAPESPVTQKPAEGSNPWVVVLWEAQEVSEGRETE